MSTKEVLDHADSVFNFDSERFTDHDRAVYEGFKLRPEMNLGFFLGYVRALWEHGILTECQGSDLIMWATWLAREEK